MCKGIILGRIRYRVEENLSRKYYVQTDPLLHIACNIVMKIEKNLMDNLWLLFYYPPF